MKRVKEKKNLKILGLDPGVKHTGIAISLEDLPLGLETVSNKESNFVINRVLELVKENEIELILIGVPKNSVFGKKQEKIIKKFAEKLDQFLIEKGLNRIKIEYFDENFTTMQARRYSNKSNEHQEAARLLIEDWISSRSSAG